MLTRRRAVNQDYDTVSPAENAPGSNPPARQDHPHTNGVDYRGEAIVPRPPLDPRLQVANLSPREREVARLVAKGLSNKMIAKVLEISPWTVAAYLKRMFAKFDVHSRAALVARILNMHGT